MVGIEHETYVEPYLAREAHSPDSYSTRRLPTPLVYKFLIGYVSVRYRREHHDFMI